MTRQTMNTATRDIFGEMCSAWSVAPFKGGTHAAVTIGAFLKATRGTKYAAQVERTRALLASAWEAHNAGNEARRDSYLDDYKDAKAQAPAAVLQGVCPSWKNNEFESLARVLCLDIDGPKPGEPDNGNAWVQDWNQVKNQLAALPWVAYCALSAGGRGVFVLIPIERADAQTYGAYYETWETLLKRRFNLATDSACKNLARLRFMTHDPAPIINRAALVWDKVLQIPQDWRQGHQLATPCDLTPEQQKTVRDAVTYCTAHGVSIADDYDDWLHLAAFFAHSWNDAEGRELFHQLAALSPKYRERENDYKLQDLAKQHPNPVKFGTFVKLCKDNGVPVPGASRNPAPFPSWQPIAPRSAAPPAPAPLPLPPINGQPNPQPANLAPAPPMPWGAAPTLKRPYWTPCDPEAVRGTMRREAAKLEGHPFPFTPCKDEGRAVSSTPAPIQEPPTMSASEATILEAARDFIAEGRGMLARMRAENADLDKLCNDFDLDYCGHIYPDGKGWIMTPAQFAASTRDNQGTN